MSKYLTDKQELAIRNLKKAIKELGKQGIQIFGMDQDILFVTTEAIKECQETDKAIGLNYNPAADTFRVLQYERDQRCGTIVTGYPYIDSGGW